MIPKPTTEPSACPRCNGWIPDNWNPASHAGALSRLDNATEICTDCGVIEALQQYAGRLKDWRKK